MQSGQKGVFGLGPGRVSGGRKIKTKRSQKSIKIERSLIFKLQKRKDRKLSNPKSEKIAKFLPIKAIISPIVYPLKRQNRNFKALNYIS